VIHEDRVRRARVAATLLLTLGLGPGASHAQLAVSNLLVGQNGNLPFRLPHDRTDLYDQLNLDYVFDGGRAGVRFETDQNSENLFSYRVLTQRYAEWNEPRLRARVGTFYTILGRGLIHRSFELPGVVLDQPGVLSRFGPSRDLDGALLDGMVGPVTALLFSGQPNVGDTSPGLDPSDQFRHQGQITGGQITTRTPGHGQLGAAFLRANYSVVQRFALGTGFAGIDPLALAGRHDTSLPLYFEYAMQDGAVADWARFRTDAGTPHALYASANVLTQRFALSAEWKDYTQFRLGSNDPPSLVREHSDQLLNRSTHVLDAGRGERGYQIEASVRLLPGATLLANTSRSDDTSGVRFDERYGELRVAPAGAAWEAALFADEGSDGFGFVSRRHTLGGSALVKGRRGWSGLASIQAQQATRLRDRFDDQYAALTLTRVAWGSAGVVWERSTDPDLQKETSAERAARGGRFIPRQFLAGILQARLSSHHEVTVFYGQRRGGRACTAGTCYEVAPFQGAELRLTTRL
jgi:Family of unknown function (DUF6029)